MDLSGYGLDEETVKKLSSDIAAHVESEVSGLKAKNNELIDREKSAKTKLEELEIKGEQDKHDAAKALADKEGNLEQYKAALAQEKEAMDSLKAEIQQRNNDALMLEQKTEFSKYITDDPAAQDFMARKFADSLEVVEGKVRPKDLTKSLDDLKSDFLTNDDFKKYVKADVGTGAGAAGSQGAGSAGAGKIDFGGSQSERVNAAVAANPKLATLPQK